MTPYFQKFVITTENEKVFIVGVFGEDSPHGLGLAIAKVQEQTDSQIWDSCAFPVSGNADPKEFIKDLKV